MSGIEQGDNPERLKAGIQSFPDFEVSWVGEHPWNGGLIYGSDDGRLRSTGLDGRDATPPWQASDSEEAINGVAFAGNSMAVSTRCEVTFFDFGPDRDGVPTKGVFPGGAHGVVATSTGGFVAPLGPGGLLLMTPEPGPTQSMRKLAMGRDASLYKVARLHGDGHEDLFACAARRGGLLAVTIGGEGHAPTRFIKAPNLDVVDVCALGTPQWPRAVAGLGADRSLHLCRDLMDGAPPVSLDFSSAMTGNPYSVLHSRGHVFLHTSRGVHCLPRFASRFLKGDDVEAPAEAFFLSISAVDIYLIYDNLIIVKSDGVAATTVDSIIAKAESVTGTDTSAIPDIPGSFTRCPQWELAPVHSISRAS